MMGTVEKHEEDETEEDTERKRSHPSSNCVEQATGEVYTIFGGGNIWGKDSATPSVPHKLGSPGGAVVTMTKQATTFPAEGHAPTARTTAQNLHKALMGDIPMLNNTEVGVNVMGVMTGTVTSPTC